MKYMVSFQTNSFSLHLPLLRILLIFIISSWNAASYAQIWSENFNAYPNGTINAPPKWTSTATDCDDGNINTGPNSSQWGVHNGTFTINDIEGAPCCSGMGSTGGGGMNEWLSEIIDISVGCNISISLNVSGMGSMECDSPGLPVLNCTGNNPPDNSHDQVVAEYSLNGGGFVQFGYVCGNTGLGVLSAAGLNGSTLQIRLQPSNKANAEFYFIDDIVVDGAPPILPTFAPIGPLCETDPPITLPAASNEGITGTWNVGPVFNPAGQGGSSAMLTFTPTPGQCAAAADMTIMINSPVTPPLIPIGPVCSTDPPVNLDPMPGGISGAWTGTGVVGNFFNPTGLNGVYMLTFTPFGGQCASISMTNATVTPAGVPLLTPTSICESDPLFDLTTLQDPTYPAGTWSGQNVVGTFFNPSGLSGPIQLTFTASGQCVLPSITTITVLPSAIPILGNDEICSNNGLYNLGQLQDPLYPNGQWSGQNVIGNMFNPLGLSGNIPLTYTPSQPCVATTVTFINIVLVTTPTLGTDQICENEGAYDLSQLEDPLYTNGTWMGQNVAGNLFNPSGLNGNILLTFVPNNNCVENGFTSIEVLAPSIPNLGTDNICENSGLYDLNNLVDPNFPNGNWSGQNVVGNNFDPTSLNGNITLTFTPSDVCVEMTTTTINVSNLVTPTLGNETLCDDNGLYDLTNLEDPNFPNGNWSGQGVFGNNFDPSNQSGNVLLTFTPTGDCATISTTTIEVTPISIPNLAEDAICDNFGDYDLNNLLDLNFPTGTWSGQNVTGTTFSPMGLNGNVQLTFTSDQDCVEPASTFINVTIAENPSLSVDAVCENSGTFNLNNLLDPNFPTGTWNGQNVTGNDFDPTGLSGNILLTFNSDQACVQAATTTITVTSTGMPNLANADICVEEGIFNLMNLQDINFPTGTWSGQNVSGNELDPIGLNGNVPLTFTPDADCSEATMTSINVFSAPSFLALTEDCDQTNATYTVTFEITGGDPTSYTVDNNSVGSNIFTSTPISSGSTYSFEIDDANGCGPIVVSGSFDCACITDAGTMNFTNAPLQVCDGQPFSAIFNEDETLDPDDILQFILHDNSSVQAGNILATSDSPSFNFPTGITFGQTYYVSAIAGSNDGNGAIDLSDGCLSVAQGLPVVFYQLDVQWSEGGAICVEECYDFNLSFNGIAPFDLNYVISTEDGDFNQNLMTDSENLILTICPSDFISGSGTITIFPINLMDANCMTDFQNPENQTITINPLATSVFIGDACTNESIIVNGTIYDVDNPTGLETIPGGSYLGCDSIISVGLNFLQVSETLINDELCTGGSILVNGNIYDATNASGTEILLSGSENGCDSIITIDLTFNDAVTFNLGVSLCQGASIDVNGTTYDEDNPFGTETFIDGSYLGCDSTVNIALDYYPPAEFNLTQTLCDGSSIIINGIVYDEDNPSGIEVLQGESSQNCDSTIFVNLSFETELIEDFTPTLCAGQFVEINGNIYDQDTPIGTEFFQNGSYLGCDSTININLSFYPPSEFILEETLCEGGSILVNGTLYDQTNPVGTETLENATNEGCDSTIFVQIFFSTSVTFNLDETLCEGQFIEVNGTIYNQDNPFGSETFENGSALGCDSIINVALSFDTSAESFITEILCEGSSLIINGTTYDDDNPSGTEILIGAAFNGCDSIIQIDLTFDDEVLSEFIGTYCFEEIVIVNGTIYDQSNPFGFEVLEEGSYLGCDSIIAVALTFYPPAAAFVNETLCFNENLTVNGTVYNNNNPNGVEILAGIGANGCDSTIKINLAFFPPAASDLIQTLCSDDALEINGTTYDMDNPSGIETLIGASSDGCDSTINVNLAFFPPAISDISQTLCTGGSLAVNGTTYDENNPTGIEILTGASSNGCDSTIFIDLDFNDVVVFSLNESLCKGESMEVDGVIYNESNPTGSALFENGSFLGCDSMVNISLVFFEEVVETITLTLEVGESIEVNGVIYDENNISGTEILSNGASNGCDSTIIVSLTFEADELIVEAIGQSPACADDADGMIVIENIIGGSGTSYFVNFEGQFPVEYTDFPIILSNLESGTYSLEISDGAGTNVTTVVEIPAGIEVIVSLEEDQTIQLGQDLALLAQTNADVFSISWLPSDHLSCTDCLNPLVEQLQETTTYTLAIEDQNGCLGTDDLTIFVQKLRTAYIPNVFSPNGDGFNDRFTVYGNQKIVQVNTLKIFSRWGESLFEVKDFQPNDVSVGWDGTSRGENLDAGVYIYFAEIEFVDGRTEIFKGDVVLMR